MIGRSDFGRDWALDHFGDLGDHVQDVATGLCDQAGVGGHAVHQAGVVQFTDRSRIGAVDEEFHGAHTLSWRRLADGFGPD